MDTIPTYKTFAMRMPHYNYYIPINVGLPNFPSPNLLRTEFTKLYAHQTFLLYSRLNVNSISCQTVSTALFGCFFTILVYSFDFSVISSLSFFVDAHCLKFGKCLGLPILSRYGHLGA